MSDDYTGKQFKLWMSATYCIEVEGHLDDSWSDRLAGMQISSRKRADQSSITTLTGRVRDQAELAGVLNSLYELHLPILSVKIINESNGNLQDSDKASPSGPEREDRTE